MIPYDELVASLARWRVSQGLPVSDLGGAPPSSIPGGRTYHAGDDSAVPMSTYVDSESTSIGEVPESMIAEETYDAGDGIIEEEADPDAGR